MIFEFEIFLEVSLNWLYLFKVCVWDLSLRVEISVPMRFQFDVDFNVLLFGLGLSLMISLGLSYRFQFEGWVWIKLCVQVWGVSEFDVWVRGLRLNVEVWERNFNSRFGFKIWLLVWVIDLSSRVDFQFKLWVLG